MKENVAFLISTIAIVLSGVSLWQSYLKPFKLEVVASTPHWFRVLAPIKDSTESSLNFMILSNIEFLNEGSKGGKVEDVIYHFKGLDNDGEFSYGPASVMSEEYMREIVNSPPQRRYS